MPADSQARTHTVSSPFRSPWLVVLLAFAVPIAFACFTDHAWEDYFITLRSSRNLVEGHGLVFNVGERVHTFTSPLGVLVPALCTWLAGPGHEALALWLFRIIGAGLLALAVLGVWRRAATLGLRAPGRFVLFGLILADAKLADCTINGMETALLVFFLLLLWTELESPVTPRASRLGLALAGLMWTRPDAFILAGAVIVPHLIFRRRDPLAPTRPRPWRPLLRAALLGGALYLPWFAWAWWYYGSPIPHTIVAKSSFAAPVHPLDLLRIPFRTLAGRSLLQHLFLPSYSIFGGWPVALAWFARFLSALAAFAWLVPGLAPVARRLSLAVFLGMFYVCSIFVFPWYLPPWTVLAALALAFTFDHACSRLARIRPTPSRATGALLSALRIAAAAGVCTQAAVLLASAWQMRVQQRLIEDSGRRDIGLWLRAHAAPRDTVFLESLGYIGYYSQLKTYDFPGLSSPEVVAAIRGGATRYVDLIAQLRPAWLVLRPADILSPEFADRPILRDYVLVRTWDALPALDAIRFLPGRNWLNFDAQYLLYRRR